MPRPLGGSTGNATTAGALALGVGSGVSVTAGLVGAPDGGDPGGDGTCDRGAVTPTGGGDATRGPVGEEEDDDGPDDDRGGAVGDDVCRAGGDVLGGGVCDGAAPTVMRPLVDDGPVRAVTACRPADCPTYASSGAVDSLGPRVTE